MRAVNARFDGATMRVQFTRIDVEAESSEARDVISGILNRAGFEVLPPRPATPPVVSTPRALPAARKAAPASPPPKSKAAGKPKDAATPAASAPIENGNGKRRGPESGTLASDVALALTTGPKSTEAIVEELAKHGRTTTPASVEQVIYVSLRRKYGYEITREDGKWHFPRSRS